MDGKSFIFKFLISYDYKGIKDSGSISRYTVAVGIFIKLFLSFCVLDVLTGLNFMTYSSDYFLNNFPVLAILILLLVIILSLIVDLFIDKVAPEFKDKIQLTEDEMQELEANKSSHVFIHFSLLGLLYIVNNYI